VDEATEQTLNADKQKRVEGSHVVVELDPHPFDVLQFHQSCSRLKQDKNFQRRIIFGR